MSISKEQLQKELQIDIQLHEHIILVSSLLKDLINDGKSQQQKDQQCDSIFDSKKIPQISIQQYLRRIHKLTNYSAQSLIISIIIMDRYMIQNDNFQLNWLNVHRLLLSCLILGINFIMYKEQSCMTIFIMIIKRLRQQEG